MLRIFLIISYFIFYNVDNTTAFSKIYLQLKDSKEDNDNNRNARDRTDSRNSRSYDDIELISKALEIVKQEKSGINTVEINKCLSLYVGNTKNKFNCIRKLLYKGKPDKNKKNFYMNLYSKGRLPHTLKHKNNFVDLTKSGHDVKRSFHDFFDFSNDYLDINDLLRSYNKIDENESVKTENNVFVLNPGKNGNGFLRTLSFSADYLDADDLRTNLIIADIENNLLKDAKPNNYLQFKLIPTKNEVKNLRFQRKFSKDYFDVKDLLRTNPKIIDETPKEMKNEEGKKQLYVFKLIPTTKDLRRFRNIAQNDIIEKNKLRTVSDESDSSVSSDESITKDKASKEDEEERKDKQIKDKKSKRFHVIDNSVMEESSEENTSNESDIPIQRPIEIPDKKNKVYYMQGSNRIFNVRNGRRRLPHFLPKRYHWNEEDMKNLNSYWFNGPQGKYWGAHKTPY